MDDTGTQLTHTRETANHKTHSSRQALAFSSEVQCAPQVTIGMQYSACKIWQADHLLHAFPQAQRLLADTLYETSRKRTQCI